MPAPKGKGYVIDVASDKNGVGYGKWTDIEGWGVGYRVHPHAGADRIAPGGRTPRPPSQ